jgi:peptidyl-tRNA hydrolase, PTH1 family
MGPALLIVGLGNPGSAYRNTRHNLGFRVVEALAQKHQIALREQRKWLGRLGSGVVGAGEVHLLLPSTFMNESGRAVRKVVNAYKLPPSRVVVVCDDADLSFGKMRWRPSGSSGGHRGLQSIAAYIGSDHPRLRVGIGRSAGDLADYVLETFEPEEQEELDRIIQEAVRTLEEFAALPAQEPLEQKKSSEERDEGTT